MPLAAVGQICSTASLSHNLQQCQKLVKKASEAGASAIFLPEASDYINTNPSLKLCKSVEDSEFVQGLLKSAKEYKLPISVGIHEPAAGDKTKNTLIWINEEGKITQRYQKLHLFDVDIKDGPSLQESKSVERGTELPRPFDTVLGKIGMQICFDMRFPQPGLAYAKRGAHIITYPSAFTTETGKAGHWHMLLRARAIETQSYIIAAGQVGKHDEEGKRHSYGHSMIIDPWGRVVAELGGEADEKGRGLDEGEIAVAEIDVEYVEKIRKEIPLTRRTDVYAELE
ncbi:carbon-nitrogen hydrolase [Lizonia empirigonia]|nr:carbon-nitrogen hydrolase [Lizonia empirigonia]